MGIAERNTDNARWLFPIIVAVMLAIAAGHLYVIEGLTDLYLGLPLWLWIQLLVIAVLFGFAWIATGLATPAGRN